MLSSVDAGCEDCEVSSSPVQVRAGKSGRGEKKRSVTARLDVCKLGNDAGTIGAAMLWKLHE